MVTVQVADGVRLRFARSAVQNVIEAETTDKKEQLEAAKA